MIYKRGYRRIVASKQLKSGGLTFFRSLGIALLSALLAVLFHFIYVILARSDADLISGYLYTTHYGNLYTYTFINSIIIFFLFLIKAHALCFPEITTNRWNLLTSMGIPISGLVCAKIYSTLLALWRQYLIGYLLSVFCGTLFGFEFHINYIIALFFVGCVNLALTYMLPTALSVFVKKNEKARVNLLLGSSLVSALNFFYGFARFEKTLAEGRLAEMFRPGFASYIAVAAAIYTACYAVILIVARARSCRQELMPLGVFEIRPLVSGRETELFMTDGMRHTTIIDAARLKERDDSAARAEKPDMANAEESAAFPYGLMIILSVLLAVFCCVSAVLSLILPDFSRPVLGALLGEGLAGILMTAAGRILLGALTAAFFALAALLFVRRRERRKED